MLLAWCFATTQPPISQFGDRTSWDSCESPLLQDCSLESELRLKAEINLVPSRYRTRFVIDDLKAAICAPVDTICDR